MLVLVLLVFAPATLLAEPMLYMFPTNPQLHPQKMYPNQQFMRGKVRDLPDSGVIYLNRIKPIGQEFQQVRQSSVAEVEVEVQNLPKQNKAPSSFEKYNSEEERSPKRLPTSTVPPPQFPEKKINEQKQSFQKVKATKQLSVPEEAELDRLLGDLLKNDNVPKKTLQMSKIGRSGSKRHVGAFSPKLISFDGTARVEKPRFKAFASPTSVRLPNKKSYNSGSISRNQGPDFDPWERMGQ